MANNPKLEGAMTIPSSGWSCSVTDTVGGPITVTVTGDGDAYCFLSSGGTAANGGLVTALQTALNAAALDTYTVALSNTTGKVTITAASGNTAFTWTDTDLRDALGFDGNVSGASAHTGADQAAALWLSDSPFFTPNNAGADGGRLVSDFSPTVAPNGKVQALYNNKYRVETLSFDGFTRPRCWQASEATTNESLERFMVSFVWGESGYGTPSGPIASYPDRDVATFNTFGYAGDREFTPQQKVQGLSGHWMITIDNLIEVPS